MTVERIETSIRNQGYRYRDRVRPGDAGATVLDYHVERFPHASRAEWRARIESGAVRVNAEVVDGDRPLAAGDELVFDRAPWVEPEAPCEFEVVHEDEDVLVVAKPAGLQVLPAGLFLQHTLLNLVRGSDPSRAQSSPIHRLGRGTSGLVLFGQNARACAALSKELREFRVTKTYLALARGTNLPTSCRARHPIGERPHGPMRVYCVDANGKESLTRVRVLERDRPTDRSLVAAQPITGRADQIRIHLAALGAPLVGDPLFGVGGVPRSEARPGEGGYCLHAVGLGFRHPGDGRRLRLRSRPTWS